MTTNIDKPGTGPVLDIDHLKVTFATDAGDVLCGQRRQP